jgi:hypothetical protein
LASQKNDAKPGKFKKNYTYFLGTKTTEIIEKLMGLKKNVNCREIHIPGI